MRDKIVAGNWKMNKNLDEGLSLSSEIINILEDEAPEDVKVILCPPFIHLSSVSKLLEDTKNVFLGAQNCNENEAGAYTGEISASMLQSTGADYVILGHSERRQYFKENDELLLAKVKVALNYELKPIFCCGEPLEVRETEDHFEYVCDQLTNSIFHLEQADFEKLVLAYEPIWAIGTGKTATPEQAQEMHQRIREHISGKFNQETADNTTILYGGSCKPSNAGELFANKDVDGGLIGGASLKSRDFVDIIKAF